MSSLKASMVNELNEAQYAEQVAGIQEQMELGLM